MSYAVFQHDLSEIIKELSNANAPNQNALARLATVAEPRILVKRLNELYTDLIAFAQSQSQYDLREMLESFSDFETEGYHAPNLIELEARARRIDRAIRLYISDSKNTGIGHSTLARPSTGADRSVSQSQQVFVVHGHDDAVLHQVCRVVSDLGLEPVVLREQPNKGATIIEKFETFSDVMFAIVLMTADDMGGTLAQFENNEAKPRARQNVIMELGYFYAKLARKNVAVLKSSDVEEPSDIFGVIYTPIDQAGAWRLHLGRELRSAGFEVDLNRL